MLLTLTIKDLHPLVPAHSSPAALFCTGNASGVFIPPVHLKLCIDLAEPSESGWSSDSHSSQAAMGLHAGRRRSKRAARLQRADLRARDGNNGRYYPQADARLANNPDLAPGINCCAVCARQFITKVCPVSRRVRRRRAGTAGLPFMCTRARPRWVARGTRRPGSGFRTRCTVRRASSSTLCSATVPCACSTRRAQISSTSRCGACS